MILEKDGDWNTLFADDLGYKIDYPKDWNLYHAVSEISFYKYFEKDEKKISCFINVIFNFVRPVNHFLELGWEVDSTVTDIGNTPVVKIMHPEFQGNVKYHFGPNPNFPEK